mgnify:CR=1 FL=1
MTMWKFLLLTFLALAKADVWDENSSGEPRRNYCCHVKCGVIEARRAEGAKRFKIFFLFQKKINTVNLVLTVKVVLVTELQNDYYCQSSTVKIIITVKVVLMTVLSK